MTDDIYERLATHLSSLGMGYPPKEELLEILKDNLSSLEASVALLLPTRVIPFEPVSVSSIASSSNMSEKELIKILDNLAHRGLLFSGKTASGEKGYALQQFGYGFPQTFFWRGLHTPHAKTMAKLVVKYAKRDQIYQIYGSTETKAFRYIPSFFNIKPEEHAVFPLELMDQVVEKAKVIALVHCACRATADLLERRECTHPLENCMKYDELAEYVIETGIGKEITKTRALEIINSSEEQGLIHLVDNAQEGIKHTCNCCHCCCWSVGTIRRRRIPRDVLMATYYIRKTDLDTCTGCGLCVDACPVNAVTMHDNLPVVDEEWCIGCGVCGRPCPVSAVQLVRKSEIIPPKNFIELHNRILKERHQPQADTRIK